MCLPINHIVSEGYFTENVSAFLNFHRGTLFLLKEKKSDVENTVEFEHEKDFLTA